MTSASPIIPSERIVTIDILRGIALFIVLVINAATEFRVSIFEQLLPGTPAATTADKLADGFVLALSTKGFILFSFLFGLGLAIQFDRFAGKSNRLALMLRRLTVLLAIGLVHLLLIWNGDILTEYAMVGFAVLPFLYGPRWLLGITAAVSMAFFLATPLLPPIMPFPDSTWISQHVEQARGVYGSGSFMQILALRIEEVRYILPFHANAMPRTFGLFLCGALVWRTGFFRRPLSRTPVILAACFSLAIGAWMTMASTNAEAFGWSLNWRSRYIVLSLSQLILAAGYALLIVAVTDSAVGKRLLGGRVGADGIHELSRAVCHPELHLLQLWFGPLWASQHRRDDRHCHCHLCSAGGIKLLVATPVQIWTCGMAVAFADLRRVAACFPR